jgi:glycosyltransferase involved in cell wall biosynthesis
MTESTRQDHGRVWWKETVKKLLLKVLFDGAIAGGRRHVAYLKELGVRGRIGHCYDVVDNQFFSIGAQQAQTAGRPDHLPSRYFLYVGRLAGEKNLSMLLRSFSAYRRRGGDWPLILVGDGPERGALEALAAEERVADGVHFAGQRSTEEIVPYYAFAGCFVLPSVREPWGLVVNEAMAAGLPVIVSEKCGCVEDLVAPGLNGFCFDPSRQEQLTEALSRITRLTPSERAEMGAASREQVGKYSLQRWAEEVFQLVN